MPIKIRSTESLPKEYLELLRQKPCEAGCVLHGTARSCAHGHADPVGPPGPSGPTGRDTISRDAPLGELRWLQQNGSAPRLQQKWRTSRMVKGGKLVLDYQWRDVPTAHS